MGHMLKNIRIHRLYNTKGAVAKSTQNNGSCVDMAGFEGCLFIALGTSKQMGASTDKMYLAIQGASATGGTFKTLYGSSAAPTAQWTSANLDYKVLAVDVWKPLSTAKILRPTLIGTCTGDFGGVLAIQYGGRVSSTDIYKSSTRAGSTLWESTAIGAQTICLSATQTTATTG